MKLTLIITVCIVGYFTFYIGKEVGKVEGRQEFAIQYYTDTELNRFVIETAEVIKLESNNRHVNIWGDGGKSYGRYQIQKSTFYYLSHLAKFEGLDWKDPYHQFIIWKWAYYNGYAKEWAGYRKLFLKGRKKTIKQSIHTIRF